MLAATPIAIIIVSRFALIAAQGCGFVMDALVTFIAWRYLSINPVAARMIGVVAGIVFTMMLTRTRLVAPQNRWLVNVIGVIAAFLSLAIYGLLLTRNPFIQPSVALAASIVPALIFSAFGYARFFHKVRSVGVVPPSVLPDISPSRGEIDSGRTFDHVESRD